MDLSGSYKKLLKDWEMVIRDGDIFLYFDAPVWLTIRDEIEELGLGELPEVKKLDAEAIKRAIEVQADPPMDRDEENPPLKRWWWYLDLIAEKRYPAELLPEHLREIYQK